MQVLDAHKDDVWVRSHCDMCLNWCGTLVHRVDGKVVKIEGDPDNPQNRGKICAKGNSALLQIMIPDRITTPMRRTNPEKGFGIDPKFAPISWDEALDTVAQRLSKIRADNPRKLYFSSFDVPSLEFQVAWTAGFGTIAAPTSAMFFCGNAVHNIHLMNNNSFEADPDPELAKYILLVGAQFGSIAHYDVMNAARGIAEKRPGGVKVVVVDPMGGYCGSKAEEWVPIRPGTDCAFLMSVTNLLLNEYKIFDAEYLRRMTNAPYLIKEDGTYLRDKAGKPMVWNLKEKGATAFDQTPPEALALEGSYTFDGTKCSSAFQKLKEHSSKYTEEYASEITTVPRETIRRVAKEFGEAANIGGTIDIGGVEMPYRPASVAWYRGLSSHKHAMMTGMAAESLNVLVGAIDTPGGQLGSGRCSWAVTKDGLLVPAEPPPHRPGRPAPAVPWFAAYPARKTALPQTPDMLSLFPVATYSHTMIYLGILQPEVYKVPFCYDMLISVRSNLAKTSAPSKIVEPALRKIPFIASFARKIEETTLFADVVFPDLHYLERAAFGLWFRTNPIVRSGTNEYDHWYGQKPVVKAPIDSPWKEKFISTDLVLLELAKRAGFLGDVYEALNRLWRLEPPYRLDRNEEYSFEELMDRCLKNLLGEDHGSEWFRKDGLYLSPRKPEERYTGPFKNGRAHLYYEFMVDAGKDAKQVTEQAGIPWDTSGYQPLPDWKPCPAYESDKKDGFDLYLINRKTPQQGFSHTQANPLLGQLEGRHKDDYIFINTETGTKMGLQNDTVVEVENIEGTTMKGRVRLTELLHPEVVSCQGNNRRTNFNNMLVYDKEHIDHVTSALDSCVRVRVRKAPAS